MTPMATKRLLLATLCESVLQAHAAPLGLADVLHVETRYRRQTEPTAYRADRVRLMGDPCWYLEVLHAGPFTPTVDVSGGRVTQGLHAFRVSVWRQYHESEAYEASSQYLWDQMIHAESDDVPGLLRALRDRPIVGTGDDRVVVYPPEGESDDVIPLDEGGEEAAHYLTMTVQVEG